MEALLKWRPSRANCSPRHPPDERFEASAASQRQPRRNTAFDNRVRLVEVGPRDGLQNEKEGDSGGDRAIDLIQRLAKTGLSTIEAGSLCPQNGFRR